MIHIVLRFSNTDKSDVFQNIFCPPKNSIMVDKQFTEAERPVFGLIHNLTRNVQPTDAVVGKTINFKKTNKRVPNPFVIACSQKT